MDYRNCAGEILDAIGGKENLASAAHCATRLRLVIADNDKVKKETLENIDGVKGVFEAAGQARADGRCFDTDQGRDLAAVVARDSRQKDDIAVNGFEL